MEEDEERTVRTMESYRKTTTSLIEQHNGRVVDSPGDNLLAEFASVVDAVLCAVEIQHVIKAKNAGLPEARRMQFRIGISLEDVIEEEDRIYGDGVNIAARLESLSDAGGICISGRAYDHIANKLALGYEDIGTHSVKNISSPIQAYRIPMESEVAGGVRAKKRGPKRFQWAALILLAGIIVGIGSVAVWYQYLKSPSTPERATPETSSTRTGKPTIAVLDKVINYTL
jgi:adenylate cyclase